MLSMNTKAKNYEEMTPEEKIKFDVKKKRKILGNMNFIGELFVSTVIS